MDGCLGGWMSLGNRARHTPTPIHPYTHTQIHPSMTITANTPDTLGHFGQFGGRFVPETLIPALDELTEEYARAKADSEFNRQLEYYFQDYIGRPTPLYFAERLTELLGGPKIYIK